MRTSTTPSARSTPGWIRLRGALRIAILRFVRFAHFAAGHTIGRNGVAGNVATPTDLLPHNGPGISTSFVDVNSNGYCDPADYVRFDMDGDGNPDAVLDPTTDPLASGPAGCRGLPSTTAAPHRSILPQTHSTRRHRALRSTASLSSGCQLHLPDINNIFLAYEAVVGGRRIFIPSFHRPDLLMSYRQNGFDDVFTDVETRRLVMRPHAEHRYPDGNRRFITQGFRLSAETGDDFWALPVPGGHRSGRTGERTGLLLS